MNYRLNFFRAAALIALALLLGGVAQAGSIQFMLVEKLKDGQQQFVDVGDQTETILVVSGSTGDRRGQYVLRESTGRVSGEMVCEAGGCVFGGSLQAWGQGTLDQSGNHLTFRYSREGHEWRLWFRRVRVIECFYPFCQRR